MLKAVVVGREGGGGTLKMRILHLVCDLILNRVDSPPFSSGLQNNDQILKFPDQRLFQIPNDTGEALGGRRDSLFRKYRYRN